MDIFFSAFLFLTGLSVLIFSSNWLVQASVKISSFFKLTPFFVGMMIVAFGTSSPEAGVGIIAAVKNQPDITLSNVIGSNIANIALGLGLCSIFVPLEVDKKIFKKEFLFLIISALALYLASLDFVISRVEGVFFLLLLLLFCFVFIKDSRRGFQEGELKAIRLNRLLAKLNSSFWLVFLIFFTLLGVILGAHFMVEGGVNLANILGVSPWIIGITLFALGTSLPEIATSFIAGLKKVPSISIGNVIGSNIFIILFVTGVAALIKPLHLDYSIVRFELPALLGFTFLLFTVMLTHYKIVRAEGFILVLSYVGFLFWLFMGRV